MITGEDIQKIIQAEKEVFTTKDDFAELKQMFSNLQSSVDAYAKKADTYFLSGNGSHGQSDQPA